MDDAMKRISRAHLEPYFRLHKLANVNIIRNWVGQNTEPIFYDLADEYGMMVWNDFWESTENYNAEAQDPELWLANATDTIRRYRNHPSIVMWCGRNEGVPQPVITDGLNRLLAEEDGTRYYTPSSNRINLRDSGPYHYQDPTRYFDTLNRWLLGRVRRTFALDLGEYYEFDRSGKPMAGQRCVDLSRLA
jgi:beta-galactosidase/beta-glucuronidase